MSPSGSKEADGRPPNRHHHEGKHHLPPQQLFLHGEVFAKSHHHHHHHVANPPLPVTDSLWKAALDRDWKEVLQRVSLCPWEASFRLKKTSSRAFSRGSTCLHATCLLRAPLEVVSQVLQAFRPALFMQDNDGWTPLHLNLIYGSCQETTLLLIREGGQHAARIQAKYVGSPFHLACRHRHSMAVLRELLQQDPQQLKVTTVEERPPGRFPGDLIWHTSSNSRIAFPANNTTPTHNTPVLERLYLCLAALRGDWDESRHTLQEVLTYQHSWCSDERCRYLYQYLDQNPASVREWFEGELPLHTAAAQPATSEEEADSETNGATVPRSSPAMGNRSQTPLSVISLLLDRFPDAARIPDQRTKRLPLHHALASCRDWSQGVSDLIRANAAAVDEIDAQTGLLPVALAALCDRSSSAEEDSTGSLRQLNTIFNVLCSSPSVLVSS